MAKLSNEELLDAFKEMTLIELSEFVKQFEETFCRPRGCRRCCRCSGCRWRGRCR